MKEKNKDIWQAARKSSSVVLSLAASLLQVLMKLILTDFGDHKCIYLRGTKPVYW